MLLSPGTRDLALRQHGLLTRAQLADVGVSRHGWYRAQRAGRLIGVAPGVAALPGAAATEERRILAATLWAGGVASHRSAAYLWDAAGVPPVVDVTLEDRRRRDAPDWIRVHRPRDRAELRRVRRRGVDVTNPLRTLVDLGQVAPEAVSSVLAAMLGSGLVNHAAVEASVLRHSRRGRHGVVALRAALEAWSIAGKPPDSLLELVMADLLRQRGLPAAVFHHRVRGFEVDFCYPVERIIIECDGWEVHGRDRAQFERDRRRDAALIADGWIVIRFTWSQITQHPDWVCDVIRQTLAARSGVGA
jgi:very-short-patch-repair endonuclease